MSDEKPKTIQDLGTLGDNLYMTVNAGTGEYQGHELRLATAMTGEPIIYANGQAFYLPWKDIIWIAEQRGLFKER